VVIYGVALLSFCMLVVSSLATFSVKRSASKPMSVESALP
jgi:hypothetical protein